MTKTKNITLGLCSVLAAFSFSSAFPKDAEAETGFGLSCRAAARQATGAIWGTQAATRAAINAGCPLSRPSPPAPPRITPVINIPRNGFAGNPTTTFTGGSGGTGITNGGGKVYGTGPVGQPEVMDCEWLAVNYPGVYFMHCDPNEG